MKAHFKLALIAMAGVIVSTLAASYLLTDLVTADSKQHNLALVSQLRRAARVAAEARTQKLADTLTQAIQMAMSAPAATPVPPAASAPAPGASATTPLTAPTPPAAVTPPWALQYKEFSALALLNDGAVEWLSTASPSMITSDWLKSQLAGWPVERARGDETAWARAATSDGQVYFALIMNLRVKTAGVERDRLAVGILPLGVFSALNLIAKGDESAVMVVDSQGYAYAHPDQLYLGARLNLQPLIASLIATPQTEHAGAFGAGDERVVGAYERVANTNLYAVASTPFATRNSTLVKFILQVALVALAILLVVTMLIFFVGAGQARYTAVLEKNIELLQAQNPPDTKTTPVALNEDRLRIFARSVYDYLNNTVGALLAKSVVGVSSSGTAEEWRKVREFLDGLKRKALVKDDGADEVVDIHPLMSQVISVARKEMATAKIQFEENLKGEFAVRGHFEALKDSMKTLLRFAIQHVDERSPKNDVKRKIILNVDKAGGFARISIEGRGAELKSDDRRRLFMPFQDFELKSEILGFDLALARSRIESMNGTVEAESLGSEGFRFTVMIPELPLAGLRTQTQVVGATPSAAKTSPAIPKPVTENSAVTLPPPPSDDVLPITTETVTLTTNPGRGDKR